ncbi:MAG: hypothetical protein L3J39_02790 [Verrucomicrobiales bacterium]|nr:hypothetical protein [Verrucomicrobiales bacterium]
MTLQKKAWLTLIALSLSILPLAIGEEKSANPFPADSAEHAALEAASPYLGDDAFLLRQDYWQGNLTTELGKALRLQFFKGNHYRFFFAVKPSRLPKNAQLHLQIYDKASRQVAAISSQDSSHVIELSFTPKSTDLYLIMMSIEVPKNSSARTGIPSVLFYGYK